MKQIQILVLILFFTINFPIDNYALESNWKKSGEKWNYIQPDGTQVKESWAEIDGSYYYFDRSGSMITGWAELSGKLYCFQNTGELSYGWCQNPASQKWYYYNRNGELQTGWLYERGSWYYMDDSGAMTEAGTRSIDGAPYIFFNTGQLASDQYVGLNYMDENGRRDKRYDITVVGNENVSAEYKDRITDALKDVPRAWMKHFVSQGWQIMYYPKKSFFSAPDTDQGIYYTYHTLDSSYKKLKFISPESLTRGLGEYIGYASGLYEEGDKRMEIIRREQMAVEELYPIPDYYDDDDEFYFGVICELYWNPDISHKLKKSAPELYRIVEEIMDV